MKLNLHIALALLFTAAINNTKAQTADDYSIQLEASVQTAPPKVTLSWRKIPGATLYNIFRKTKAATSWATLASTADSFYVDASVAGDSTFEYKVNNTGTTVATGFIFAGINAAAQHNRGTLVLIVDTLFRDSCATEITGLMNDLSADGWAVARHNVSRTITDVAVKSLIKNTYTIISDVKAVLIIGHAAVPYSGDQNPDGHPDHEGAWPADVFYADMDGAWTDATVNNSVASRAENKNIPGDGKWDQIILPSFAELQISRIDLSDMPSFGKSEVLLMKNYLAKTHQYKMDSLNIIDKGIVDDNFGGFGGEAFAANAWRNFPQLIGRKNIVEADFMTGLNDSAYQWGYGCGGGSYTSSGGIGTTGDYKTKKQKGIFTMMFGSYFGDWDVQNNFLRAPLCCEEPALTACWAGRPNWYFHHMALGENIGYSTLMTQNYASSLYQPSGYGGGFIHVALMGDLSLRTKYIKRANNLLVATAPKSGASLSWTASPDVDVLGYYVYRADSIYGKYTKISGLIPTTFYKDTVGKDGSYVYMVRPSKLQTTASGSYYNLGLGITKQASVSFPVPVSIAGISMPLIEMICFPNPANNVLNVYANLTKNNGDLSLRIMDISGKIMIEKNYFIRQNELTISENIAHFAPGTYFVQLSLNNEMLRVQKIVKQ